MVNANDGCCDRSYSLPNMLHRKSREPWRELDVLATNRTQSKWSMQMIVVVIVLTSCQTSSEIQRECGMWSQCRNCIRTANREQGSSDRDKQTSSDVHVHPARPSVCPLVYDSSFHTCYIGGIVKRRQQYGHETMRLIGATTHLLQGSSSRYETAQNAAQSLTICGSNISLGTCRVGAHALVTLI